MNVRQRLPSGAESLVALREIARRLRAAVRHQDLPQALRAALLHHFGSIAHARRLAGVPGPEPARRWSRERVIAEFRALHRAGIELRATELQRVGRHDLLSAAAIYAGGLIRARELAGVPAPRRRSGLAAPWDPDRVIAEIKRRHRAGETLAHGKAWRPLVRAGGYFFGTWRDAIEAAGLDYDRIRLVRPAYTKEELLTILRRLARQHPEATLGAFSRPPLQKYRIVLAQHFGGVAKAAIAAGLRDWPRRRKHELMTAAQVKATLRERHRQDKTLHENPVAREDPHLVASARRRFGSWRDALEAARLAAAAPMPRSWTRETILRALRARRRAKRDMNPAALKRDDTGLYQAAARVFGDYWSAARQAGALRPPPVWTAERCLRELRALGRGSAAVTTPRAGVHLASACQRFFGTFAAACQAAGVERRQRTRWSKERVLAELQKVYRRHGRATDGVVNGALAQACRTYFGSIVTARAAAGLPA